MKLNIKLLYLYLFSFVGLLITVFGSINMINVGLKTFVFRDVDKYEIYIDKESGLSVEEQQARQDRESDRQKQRELVNAISMLAVGAPLYLYHWKKIQSEDK